LPSIKTKPFSGEKLEVVGKERWSEASVMCLDIKTKHFSTTDNVIIPVELPVLVRNKREYDIRGPSRDSFIRVQETVMDALRTVIQAELNRLGHLSNIFVLVYIYI
jgi:hypothetical protein